MKKKKSNLTKKNFLPYTANEWLVALFDMFVIIASFVLSVVIVQFNTIEDAVLPMLKLLPIIFIVAFVTFFLLRIFKIIWRYSNIKDYLKLSVGCMIVAAMLAIIDGLILHWIKHEDAISVYTMFMGLSIFVLIVVRLAYAFFYAKFKDKDVPIKRRRTMIIGAGYAANSLIEELSKKNSSLQPICLIDDDNSKIGRSLQDVTVVGNTSEIGQAVQRYKIDLIIFAIPAASKERRREILEICMKTGCEVRALPHISELIYNQDISNQTHEIKIDDLLGRDPIKFDNEDVKNFIRGKVVMITGGGGSIGSELCRQVVRFEAKQLIIMDIYENTTYEIQQELLRKYPTFNLKVEIASMTDRDKMCDLLEQYHPDIIFHAAAHKHVPLMETNPEEAVKNNVFGTLNMAQLAEEYHVKKFIMISTDKAVNPTNVMGATKRTCEMIVRSMAEKSKYTEFAAVRFGNVLGSHGSVIPLFREQILNGGPVTVTHKDIIRYFMTIPEAVLLVLQAGAFAHGGEVFVLDMGKPVKIVDLAENLIRMMGKKPYTEIDIKFTGLRPGEKLYEELLMDEEGLQKTANDKIFVGHQIVVDPVEFPKKLEEMRGYCNENDKKKIVKCLAETVGTYIPDARYFGDVFNDGESDNVI